MNNGSEMERWLKDAHASLASAEKAFQAGDYRVATQNAQLCTELSAKAIIALFAEPAWRHDPGKQLQSLLEKHKPQITQQLDDQTRQNLARLAQDADEVAPWHGWSTFRLRSRQAYGRGEEDDVWIAAVDLCTQSVADDLLARARRSVETVAAFIQHTNETSHTPTRYPNAHPSGSPRTRYTRVEAERLVTHAEKITQFCSSLLSTL
jgi:HEPN domain-containing protein